MKILSSLVLLAAVAGLCLLPLSAEALGSVAFSAAFLGVFVTDYRRKTRPLSRGRVTAFPRATMSRVATFERAA